MNYEPRPLSGRTLSLLLVAVTSVGLLATGCAISPKPQAAAMTPTVTPVATTHPYPTVVVVRGGGIPTTEWRITNAELQKAVEAALQEARVFESLVPESAARLRLDVVIGSVDQPLMGGTFKVELEFIWNLYSMETQRTIWQELIKTSATVTVGEQGNAQNRLRVATERAATENVAKGVERLAAARLDLAAR